MDLLTRIDAWRQVAPDRIAHMSDGRALTYSDLIRRSNTLAAYLAWMLPNDRSPVAVLGHKEPEMLIAFLGVVKSGHPYIPLDTSLPEHRIERIIAMSGARITLTPDLVATVSDGYVAPPE